MTEQKADKPEPVATIYRVQRNGDCQDCGAAGVTVIEAEIGASTWTLICLGCLAERLGEMQERMGVDGLYHCFGQGPGSAAE